MESHSIQWGSVAEWVSGLGSFAAVITALYLSKASQKIRLDLSVGHRVIVGGGAPRQDIVSISATNTGTRATVINSLGVRTGGFWNTTRRFGIITVVKDRLSNGVPVTLVDGQRGHWGIPLDSEDGWLVEFVSGFVKTQKDIDSLNFVISTSNGGDFYVRPEKSLRERMSKVLKDRDTAQLKQPSTE